ncbi:MAG: hypothetical protein IH945_04415 [Armatimonadetes bacterium]|nr:hypothetical protein [Armatimonadota bacterium]
MTQLATDKRKPITTIAPVCVHSVSLDAPCILCRRYVGLAETTVDAQRHLSEPRRAA